MTDSASTKLMAEVVTALHVEARKANTRILWRTWDASVSIFAWIDGSQAGVRFTSVTDDTTVAPPQCPEENR